MNMIIRKMLLVFVIMMLFGLVMVYVQEGCDDYFYNLGVCFDKKVKFDLDIFILGDFRVCGCIDIDLVVIVIVDNVQINGGNDGSNMNFSNSVLVVDNVVQGVLGNIGVNIGVGDNNQQDNVVVLLVIDVSFVFGMVDGEVFVNQQGVFNDIMNVGVINVVGFGGNVFQNVLGNFGVNVIFGNNNQQKNVMVVLVVIMCFVQVMVLFNQVLVYNIVSNVGFVQQYIDIVDVFMSGDVLGYLLGYGLGGYVGLFYGSYFGSILLMFQGIVDQIGNVYLDMWIGNSYLGGMQMGYFDFDMQIQGGFDFNGDGGVLVFGINGFSSGSESGIMYVYEGGQFGFVELLVNDLYVDLSGIVIIMCWVINDVINIVSFSGSVFQNVLGNIGINVFVGIGN